MADFCVYWFRLAHDALETPTTQLATTGRAGLVGTQNIRSGDSRVASLDYITRTGTIVEAVANQPWSGEANVNVSIVSWVKSQDERIISRDRLLWLTDRSGPPDRGVRREKAFQLRPIVCTSINSSLSCAVDVRGAKRLGGNAHPQRVLRGFEPGNMQFLLTVDDARELAQGNQCLDVVRLYLMGKELVTGDGSPQRWIIDFGKRNLFDAESACPRAFEHVKSFVLPQMEKTDRAKSRHESLTSRGKRIRGAYSGKETCERD